MKKIIFGIICVILVLFIFYSFFAEKSSLYEEQKFMPQTSMAIALSRPEHHKSDSVQVRHMSNMWSWGKLSLPFRKSHEKELQSRYFYYPFPSYGLFLEDGLWRDDNGNWCQTFTNNGQGYNLKKTEKIVLTFDLKEIPKGRKFLVRLLPEGQSPHEPYYIFPYPYSVDDTVEVSLEYLSIDPSRIDLEHVAAITLHSGETVWGNEIEGDTGRIEAQTLRLQEKPNLTLNDGIFLINEQESFTNEFGNQAIRTPAYQWQEIPRDVSGYDLSKGATISLNFRGSFDGKANQLFSLVLLDRETLKKERRGEDVQSEIITTKKIPFHSSVEIDLFKKQTELSSDVLSREVLEAAGIDLSNVIIGIQSYEKKVPVRIVLHKSLSERILEQDVEPHQKQTQEKAFINVHALSDYVGDTPKASTYTSFDYNAMGEVTQTTTLFETKEYAKDHNLKVYSLKTFDEQMTEEVNQELAQELGLQPGQLPSDFRSELQRWLSEKEYRGLARKLSNPQKFNIIQLRANYGIEDIVLDQEKTITSKGWMTFFDDKGREFIQISPEIEETGLRRMRFIFHDLEGNMVYSLDYLWDITQLGNSKNPSGLGELVGVSVALGYTQNGRKALATYHPQLNVYTVEHRTTGYGEPPINLYDGSYSTAPDLENSLMTVFKANYFSLSPENEKFPFRIENLKKYQSYGLNSLENKTKFVKNIYENSSLSCRVEYFYEDYQDPITTQFYPKALLKLIEMPTQASIFPVVATTKQKGMPLFLSDKNGQHLGSGALSSSRLTSLFILENRNRVESLISKQFYETNSGHILKLDIKEIKNSQGWVIQRDFNFDGQDSTKTSLIFEDGNISLYQFYNKGIDNKGEAKSGIVGIYGVPDIYLLMYHGENNSYPLLYAEAQKIEEGKIFYWVKRNRLINQSFSFDLPSQNVWTAPQNPAYKLYKPFVKAIREEKFEELNFSKEFVQNNYLLPAKYLDYDYLGQVQILDKIRNFNNFEESYIEVKDAFGLQSAVLSGYEGFDSVSQKPEGDPTMITFTCYNDNIYRILHMPQESFSFDIRKDNGGKFLTDVRFYSKIDTTNNKRIFDVDFREHIWCSGLGQVNDQLVIWNNIESERDNKKLVEKIGINVKTGMAWITVSRPKKQFGIFGDQDNYEALAKDVTHSSIYSSLIPKTADFSHLRFQKEQVNQEKADLFKIYTKQFYLSSFYR